MHELSLAEALVRLVAERAGDTPVAEVTVRVGALTGVVPACLAFHYEGLTAGTPLAGSRLVCERVPAGLRCPVCGGEYEPDGFARVCTACGALGGEVLQGLELDLVGIGTARGAHV